MKTVSFTLSAFVAAGSTGVALLTLANFISAEAGFASLVMIGLVGFALYDYARPRRALTVSAPVIRPTLPAESTSPLAYESRRAA